MWPSLVAVVFFLYLPGVATFVPIWRQGCCFRLQAEDGPVVDVDFRAVGESQRAEPETAIPEEVVVEEPTTEEDFPLASLIDGLELVAEKPLAKQVEGRGAAFLFKCRCDVPGAAVMKCFDDIRERAKANLREPGFRPGDVPPWIKTQLTEFALTTVMEDLVKYALQVHQLTVLEGDADSLISWLENPAEEVKTYVLGGPFTFHAAFNATLPLHFEDDSGGEHSIDLLYNLNDNAHNRAKNIFNDGGKVPNLIQKSGGGKGGGGSKKKKKKASSSSGGGGGKKRKR